MTRLSPSTRAGVSELADLSLSQASDLLDRRSVGAVELLDATLARLEETEPLVHAYARVDVDGARKAARAVDAGDRIGSLHGIPFGAKDVIETAGLETTAGSRLLTGNIPSKDATCVRRLRDAGAVLVGKHATHEFACGQDVPPTQNPWRLGHYPGGSSAGGGVSVAVGSSLAALGTDAGGSVRKPAAVTGVVGLKPTHGRISLSGVIRSASSHSLDHIGIFGRKVRDVATVLEAVAGYDPADPRSLNEPTARHGTEFDTRIDGIRLGLDRSYFFGQELDGFVGEAVETALQELAGLGADLVEVEIPSLVLALPAAFTILPAEVAALHRQWLNERPGDYVDETRWMLEFGLLIPAGNIEAAHRARQRLRSEVSETFAAERLDALVTPTLPRTAPALDGMDPAVDVPGLIPYTAPWNVTGQPALSVPCGFDDDGLPIGLQIVGRPLDEATVLRVAHAFEEATGWCRQLPPLAAARA